MGLTTVVTISSGVLVASAPPASALNVGQSQFAWWNVNGGCGGIAVAPDNGGGRAVNSRAELNSNTDVLHKKTTLHINVNTWYDPGAAQAITTIRQRFHRDATCSEIQDAVGKDKVRVFRDWACVPGGWSRPNVFCNLPDSQLWYPGGQPQWLTQHLTGTGWPQGGPCSPVDGARSEEYDTYRHMHVSLGRKPAPIIGSTKVTLTAFSVDAGKDQQRLVDPIMAEAFMKFWGQVEFWMVAHGFGAHTTVGRDGRTILDTAWYDYLFPFLGNVDLYGDSKKSGVDWIGPALSLMCDGSPDAKAGADPDTKLAAEATDGALRNLFDKLADVPETTDILCNSDKHICANLFRAVQTLWNSSPTHNAALVQALFKQLVAGG